MVSKMHIRDQSQFGVFQWDSNSRPPGYNSSPLPLLYIAQGKFTKKVVNALTFVNVADTIEPNPL